MSDSKRDDEIAVRLPPALRDALVQALTNATVREMRAEAQELAIDKRPSETAAARDE